MPFSFAPVLLAVLSVLLPGRAAAPMPHDFHVTYSRLGVEGNSVAVRIRLFQDDLVEALTKREDRDVVLDASPGSDSLFQAYFNDFFVLEAGGERLAGHLLASGEEVIGREPMWWYLMELRAQEPIQTLKLSQRIMAELYDDQKNIVRVQHFPSEKTYSLYCAEGAWEYELVFP